MTTFIFDFANDPDFLEVVGYGGVAPTSGDAPESELEIIFARIDASLGYTLDDAASLRAYRRGVGQLIAYPIGSRWKAGERAGDRFLREGGPVPEIRAVELIRSNSVSFDLDGAKQSALASALSGSAFFTVTWTDVAKPDVKPVMVIPAWELFRALWGASSEFLKQLVDGMREPSVASDRILFDRDKSGLIDSETVRIHAYKDLTDREALLIGMLLTDDQFRSAHHVVAQAIATAWKDKSLQPVRPVFPTWPFSAAVELSFHSAWLAEKTFAKTVPRRVATRICSIALRPRFRVAEIVFPSSELDPGAPPARSRIRVGSADRVVIKTGRAPSFVKPPLVAGEKSAACVYAETPVLFIRLPQTARVRPAALTIVVDPADEVWGATADRLSGGADDIQYVRIEADGQETSDIDENPALQMDETLSVLEDMASERSWTVHCGGVPGGPLATIQECPMKRHPIDIMILAVETPNGTFAVVDGGTSSASRRSLGLIARLDLAAFAPEDIESLKKVSAARRLHWQGAESPDYKNWEKQHVVRGVKRSAELWARYKSEAATSNVASCRDSGSAHYAKVLDAAVNDLFKEVRRRNE